MPFSLILNNFLIANAFLQKQFLTVIKPSPYFFLIIKACEALKAFHCNFPSPPIYFVFFLTFFSSAALLSKCRRKVGGLSYFYFAWGTSDSMIKFWQRLSHKNNIP